MKVGFNKYCRRREYFPSRTRQTAYPTKQRHVPEDWNNRLHRNKNVRVRIFEYAEKGNLLENIVYRSRKCQATRHLL
jgi:hypothetical protein